MGRFCAAAFAVFCATSVAAQEDVGLIEETRRRLLQIDVTVRGPAEALEGLTAEDFELDVGGRAIESFLLDPVCIDRGPLALPSVDPLQAEAADEPPAVAPRGLVLLLFFDQSHLTAAGRHRSIEMARDLVQDLVTGANRAMIVSSARKVETFAELTTDRRELLDALDRLEADATQLDSYPDLESMRVEQVYREYAEAINHSSRRSRRQGSTAGGPGQPSLGSRSPTVSQTIMQRVVNLVRQLQQEERWRTERALARFAMVLERLADADPPKAAVYFADRVRSNPGDHYWNMLDLSPDNRTFGQTFLQVTHGANSLAYQEVVDVASSRGVRLYTVQAEGLVPRMGSAGISGGALADLSKDPLASTRRFEDAENGLAGLALETGGQVFLGAAAHAGRVAEQMRADLTCVYVISFDPQDLPEDRALSVRVRLKRPRLDARYRSRLFVDSDSVRRVSRLTHAFQNLDVGPGQTGMRVTVIPTGFRSRKYTALVQVIVPGSPLPETTWDVGMTTVFKGKMRDKTSGRVSVNRPGVPIVFETEVDFAPGRHEITAVAHEAATGEVLSTQIEGEWPDPSGSSPVVGPIALLQPDRGAFIRGGEQRREGSVGHGPDDWIRPDRPAALVTIVCRGRGSDTALLVERALEGASTAEFEPVSLTDVEQRCDLLVDRIQAGTMASGGFEYRVRVSERGTPAISASREFLAITPEEIELAGGGVE
jgi:VWFA-related protein